MNKVFLVALKVHPFLVTAGYALLVAGYYRYLDGNLKYIRPKLPAAPEDILGFEFWVPWLIIVIWLVLASFLSYRFGLQRDVGYWGILLCAFCLLSVADFYLYGVLERQVLSSVSF